MKITQPVDVFIADKLFQLTSTDPAGFDPLVRESALAGKTLVVFGGSDGIGAAIVEAAQLYGTNVYSFSRKTTGTHVQKRKQVQAALEEVAAVTGTIDMVVNTAGILRIGKLEDASPKSVSKSVDVNLVGAINVAQLALGYLRETKGKLMLFTSSSYTRGRASYGVYSATKAAIVNLTQSLADEWHDDGVSVNCVCPQRTLTPMRTKAFGEEPEGSLLTAEQVALATIDALCAEMTGQIVDVKLVQQPV
jgi:2-C-methyl-D-erythritol 4-phosphate cytidylyltransferase